MNNKVFRKTDFFVAKVMRRIGGRVQVLSGREVSLSSAFLHAMFALLHKSFHRSEIFNFHMLVSRSFSTCVSVETLKRNQVVSTRVTKAPITKLRV